MIDDKIVLDESHQMDITLIDNEEKKINQSFYDRIE